MAPVTLPPSFYNSFWSPDYRTGLEVLFTTLDRGVFEDDDIADFIQSQVKGHHALANALLDPPLSSSSDSTSSSLEHTLLSLRGASSARGEAHKALALELEQAVLFNFIKWKDSHAERVKDARDEILSKNGVVGLWEKDIAKVNAAKSAYHNKARAADESEDDLKFAPTSSPARSASGDSFTAAPKPHGSSLRRTGTVADRINAKLREASVPKSPVSTSSLKHLSIDGKILPSPPTPIRSVTPVSGIVAVPSSPTKEEAFIPPSEDGEAPTVASISPVTPAKTTPARPTDSGPILLSGLAFSITALKEIIQRFDAYLLTNPAPYSDASVAHGPARSNAALASRQRGSILGTYEKTFSGEEVVQWLRDNVEGLGGDYDRCLDAASELYSLGYLSRAGVGRGFEPNYDSYYVLKSNPTASAPAISSPLTPAATSNIQSMFKLYLPSSLGHSDEPPHARLRRDAIKADETYREAVRSAEEKRLEMEQRIERGLRIWERWERERLSVVKTVLKQYDAAISKLPARLEKLKASTTLSVEAFNPDADLKALIDGNRTGPFRPQAIIYESVDSNVPEVNFGIDLRRWSGEHGWKGMINAPQRAKGAIPDVLQGMLNVLEEMYQQISEEERRRSWIYEVPLGELHSLRNSINASRSSLEEVTSTMRHFNAPVVAGNLKLYLLELNPPVLGWEGWEDAKAVYPTVGADLERDATNALTSVLSRLPGVQLFVLDAVVKHFKDLIDSSQAKANESKEVYVTKLALSTGRCILRPQHETEITIGDRTPSLFLADLINNYSTIFPPLVEKKKVSIDRVLPIRKRTALVDQRISRSRLSEGTDPQALLEYQMSLASPARNSSPVPPVPSKLTGLGLGFGNKAESLQDAKAGDLKLPEKPKEDKEPPVTPAAVKAQHREYHIQLKGDPASEAKNESADVPAFASPAASPGSSPTSEIPPFVPLRQSAQPSTPPPLEKTILPVDAQDDEGVASPTAAILESMEAILNHQDQPVVTGSRASSLKRNTSAETTSSRLRGPRGARGPRAVPGKLASSFASPGSATASPIYHTSQEAVHESAPVESERSGGVGVSGDYTPRKGKGTTAGAFGHKSQGSVSQVVAAFENRLD